MLKGRGHDLRGVSSPAPTHINTRTPAMAAPAPRTPLPQRPMMKPEPDYEVVEFPSDQYVNAKLQPPPPPPPRPPTGHPAQAGASCGLCGGGGARVRCAECGRRALCASCDDMYHRHPKRRHHQRQALSPSQLSDDRPPLPPKTLAPPVPPPRRHKTSASPNPPMHDQRHTTLGHAPIGVRPQPIFGQAQPPSQFNQPQQLPVHVQAKMMPSPQHMGSIPFLNTMPHPAAPGHLQMQTNTLGHMNMAWNKPRGSLQGFNMPQIQSSNEVWENPTSGGMQTGWGKPLRRGASVVELGGTGTSQCSGCAHCAPVAWRYGSCASLDHPWASGGWPAPASIPTCCAPHPHLAHQHPHHLSSHTPQPYRRADSRTMSRAASRTGSRATSPTQSIRSRTSRRTKHRTPSPQPLPSSDADSESESEEEPQPARRGSRSSGIMPRSHAPRDPAPRDVMSREPTTRDSEPRELVQRDHVLNATPVSLPPPPEAPWHCEHCTFVNEPGVRVCVICCRTPTAPPRVAELAAEMEDLNLAREKLTSPVQVRESPRVEVRATTEKPKRTDSFKSSRERTSTGCGPSPPQDRRLIEPTARLVTPTREHNGSSAEAHQISSRHDMAVGPSPPREDRNSSQALRETNKTVRVSPYRDTKEAPKSSQSHSVSVGPSPPRQSISVGPSPQRHNASVGPSPPKTIQHNIATGSSPTNINSNFQKKSAGTSPPPSVRAGSRSPAPTTKTNVSNTGTSPPPQNISTQTYEETSPWERSSGGGSGGGSAARSRRRLRDDSRRERSRSRHSLSSDTRDSERSVRTAGAGWEWRSREAQPPEWGGRLARRASHLDLRRARPARSTTSSFYGDEATSPEPRHTRAASVEALAGRRGLELARLLADAEKLGYDAAEVQVALSASPEAPLEWLRSRWAGLAGAVRGAAARLLPYAPLSEREARAALARHRGSVWPAVTECVDALRRQTNAQLPQVSSSARVRGRVWGSPAGADDEAVPAAPARAEYYSSDEEWGPQPEPDVELEADRRRDSWGSPPPPAPLTAEETRALKSLLAQDGALLKDLLAPPVLPTAYDLIQSENDFIDAYNALTRSSPLPNIDDQQLSAQAVQMDHDYSRRDDEMRSTMQINENSKKARERNESQREPQKLRATGNNLKATVPQINLNNKHEVKKAKIKVMKSENHKTDLVINGVEHKSTAPVLGNQRNELRSPPLPLNSQQIKQGEEKSSNLNDIVDDTQRLIQQMKDEINSDITSLDEGHAQTSLSEHESSSNDEREESSYSETEEDTDNMSSEEKEISSEGAFEQDEVEEIAHNIETFPNRTSSEDNEQFEEALDNLDSQMEEVKNANFEILDSIARSLQEEHTLRVEISEPTTEPLDKTEEVHKQKINVSKKEDSNNNKLFVTVDSFDEIYAQLNKSTENINHTPKPIVIQPLRAEIIEIPREELDSEEIIEIPPEEPKILLTKHDITKLTLQRVMPTKVLISQRVDLMYNATVETVEKSEESEEVETQAETEQHVVDIVNKEDLNNTKDKSKSPSPSDDSELSQNDDGMDNSYAIKPVIAMEQVEIKIEDPVPSIQVADNHETIEPIHPESETQRNSSVEKLIEAPRTDNTLKTIIAKSSIPKPVKTTANIKTKVDKLAPKLLVSKVPVRRGSQKGPAPAPPKTHFGNVQSGHVKQLQSKVFNAKPALQPADTDTKPSTSSATLTKKKPAPQPPAKSERTILPKQATPPLPSPPKEKRNYFRETCRTEDEWSDSDSEDSQPQIVRPATITEEERQAPPSPPPPPTVRCVSGQIIDLATVQLPEGSPERQARMLLANGALETWEQARLAVELVTQGAAPAAALLAALECIDLPSALAYLHQDCELCATHSLPEHEMVSMLACTHRCCRECARLYFTVQVTERGIVDCVCPYCKLPELETLPEDAWLDYFAHLDILLKALLDPPVHELFQRKLRDRTLARDPNFRWCVECSSGFFVHPKQKKLRCPECRSVTCSSCRKPWNSNHEGLTCEQFAAWLEDNDPDRAAAAVQQHLRDNGLECPRCRFKYSLSRGGCMHFTCTQCKFEFCYGCGKPFMMGARCGLSDYCAKLGLHAHHPRNCLFYLRDKEPHQLQTLLQMNNVAYETQAPEGSTGRCPIQLQRETPAGLVDGLCGSEAPPEHAGLCKPHYVEYLAAQARALDPIPIMDVAELVAELRRRALPLPERGPWDTDPLYAGMCAEIVREKIPLD